MSVMAPCLSSAGFQTAWTFIPIVTRDGSTSLRVWRIPIPGLASSISTTATRRLKSPLLVAVVEIDEASPGMGILHTLSEVEPSRVTIGMKVQAVWKPAEERQGAITDIRYFKPFEG